MFTFSCPYLCRSESGTKQQVQPLGLHDYEPLTDGDSSKESN